MDTTATLAVLLQREGLEALLWQLAELATDAASEAMADLWLCRDPQLWSDLIRAIEAAARKARAVETTPEDAAA